MTDTTDIRRRSMDADKLSKGAAMPPDYLNLEAHPLANEYPMADDHELEALKTSIKKNGIYPNNKITLYQGQILDGRNRYKAGNAVEHRWTTVDFHEFIGTAEQAEEFVYTSNSARRNLSAEDKRDLAEKLIAKHPGWPTRKLAELAGVSAMTISRLRNKPDEDAKLYTTLMNAWDSASIPAQERFVRERKVDLTAVLDG